MEVVTLTNICHIHDALHGEEVFNRVIGLIRCIINAECLHIQSRHFSMLSLDVLELAGVGNYGRAPLQKGPKEESTAVWVA